MIDLKTKAKPIKDIKDYLTRKAEERRIRTWIKEKGDKLPINTDKQHIGCRDIVLQSPKLLRLFTEEQQIHQLTIKINNAYRGINISSGYAWGVIHELVKLGLIILTKSIRFKRDNTKVNYYALTSKGYEIAYPIIYPPNLHEENKVVNAVNEILGNAKPKQMYARVES